MAVLGEIGDAGLPASALAQAQAGAFEAFLSASHVTSLISMTIVAIAAIIVGFLLPHISPPTKPMERGVAPVPSNPADELVIHEAESYGEEVVGEYVDDGRPAKE